MNVIITGFQTCHCSMTQEERMQEGEAATGGVL